MRKKKIDSSFWIILAMIVIIVSTIISVKIINKNNRRKQEAVSVIATTQTTTEIKLPERKTKIVIDAGHGGESSPGKRYSHIPEKSFNLKFANMLNRKLTDMGYDVVMLRADDSTIYPKKRAEIANESNADILISIHQNFLKGNSKIHGIETWYSSDKGEHDKKLADCIHSSVIENTGAVDRKMHINNNYVIINKTNMPGCIIETGYLTNEAEYNNLLDEDYQNKIIDGIVDGIKNFEESENPQLLTHKRKNKKASKPEPKTGNTGKKTMCLTFDDGPTYNTENLLDILKKKNAKATFFVVGSLAEERPELLKREVKEGHTIGVHCYIHDYDVIYASVEAYLKDFYKAYHTIEDITGVKPEIFRFPGGSINSFNDDVYEDIICEMTELGFRYFDWNASFEDAAGADTSGEIQKYALSTTGDGDTIVMLAHDAYDKTATVKALPGIIDHFSKTHTFKAITSNTKQIKF